MGRAALARRSHLFGRDDDLAAVAQVIESLRSRSNGSLLVVGEPGVGKTQILQYARAGTPEVTVLSAQGLEAESRIPYGGLHRLLHPVFGPDGPHSTALVDAMTLADPPVVDEIPVALATLHLLRAIAEQQPVLLIVDDLDLLDAESRFVLGFLMGRTATSAVGLIASARDERTPRELPDVAVRHLRGLDRPAVTELLAATSAVALPPTVVRTLIGATGGNPRALVELLGLLDPAQLSGHETLPDPLPLGRVTESSYAEPIRRLPPPTRRALLLAAAAPGLDAATLDDAAQVFGATLESLLPAEDAGLIKVDITGVSFAHPLTRSAAYFAAPTALRREAHGVIARVYPDAAAAHRAATTLTPSETLAGELTGVAARVRAEHGPAAAATWMHRAARVSEPGPGRTSRFYDAATDAWHGGDPTQALALLDRAAAAGRSCVDGAPEATALVDFLRAQISLRCGNVTHAYETLLAAATRFEGHSWPMAIRAYSWAGMAAWFVGDPERFRTVADRAQALVGDRADELPIEARLGLDYLVGLAAHFAGRTREAMRPLASIVKASLDVVDPSALNLAAAYAISGGDRSLVRGLATRALTEARSARNVALIPRVIETLAFADCWSGRYSLSQQSVHEAIQLARETGQSNLECHLLALVALAAAINGRAEECHRYAAATKVAREHEVGLVVATAALAVAMLDVVNSRWAEAYQGLQRLLRTAPGAGHPVVGASAAAYFVEAAVAVGKPDRALQVLQPYETWAQVTNRPGPLAIAARCRALLADGAEAAQHYRRAIEFHHHTDTDFQRAYTQLLFARHLRRTRQRTEARLNLHGAGEVFQRLELDLWTKRVRVELRALGDRKASDEPSSSAVRPRELTAQQLQIARHIAEGATNREVAERLFVSRRTVDYHLRNIFQRLAINSRAELIRHFR